MHNNKNKLQKIVLPSALNLTLIGLVVLIIELVCFLATRWEDSAIRQGLFATKEIASPSVAQVGNTLAKNQFTSNLPLLLLYAAAGAIIYCLAIYIYGVFSRAAQLRALMNYINARPEQLVRSTFWSLITRVAIIVIWLVYGLFFFKVFMPYVLSSSYEVFSSSLFVLIKGLILISLVLAVALFIHVILFRLLLRRPM